MEKTESRKETETSKKMENKRLPAKYSIPMKASIENILRALKILSDKGGKTRFKDISGMFGPKKWHNTLLSYSLRAGEAFGLIAPHSGRAQYVLSEFGTKFLTAPDEQKKTMLLPKFLGFEGYRNILVQIKNSPDKTLKKDTITNAWLSVKKATLGTRKFYTTTFASVGKWCGAITDTGQTCSLNPDGEANLTQILKGKEIKVKSTATAPRTSSTASPPLTIPSELSFQVAHCPLCGKNEFSIENEELLNTVSANGTNVLIIKYTFYCRGCRNTFSRIGQQTIKAD